MSWFVLGLAVGVFFGVVLMAALAVAGDDGYELEE